MRSKIVGTELLTTPSGIPVRRRTHRDPKPRFKPDRSQQLDAVLGCPALVVPGDHAARDVQAFVEKLDTSVLEKEYSSLGRHGYHPRHVLAVWIYASQSGMRHSTKVARACVTDAAFRLLSGGHDISAPTLRRFRQKHRAFFMDAIQQTLAMAHAKSLLDAADVAVDSVRIRAHAAVSAVRTLERSKKRLPVLREALASATSDEQRATLEKKIAKHESAGAECEKSGRTSFVITNPTAALMKFPSGASAPGHRVTVAVAGQSLRLVLGVLIDGAATDYGKLEPIVSKARTALSDAGVAVDHFQVAADAGYTSLADLAFAANNRSWADVLIPVPDASERTTKYFARDRFKVVGDEVFCPAGRRMSGPYPDTDGRLKWEGVGCPQCPLRPQCTSSERARAFTI